MAHAHQRAAVGSEVLLQPFNGGKIENDTVGPLVPPTPPGPSDGLWNRSDDVTGLGWSIEIGTFVPATPGQFRTSLPLTVLPQVPVRS